MTTEVFNEAKGRLPYRSLDRKHADDLFAGLPTEQKWAEVIGTLLGGAAVFVPNMTRNQLESLRTIINRRTYGRLRSKLTTVDDVPGRVLRVQKRAKA